MKIVSIFSGGGFLDLGFMNQGFNVVEAMELKQAFIDCYNFGISNYVKKSQKQVFSQANIQAFTIMKSTDASTSTVISDLAKYKKEVAGIIGGPPCQDFSNGGKHKGTEGNRGKLIFTYLKIVQTVKPQFIFFENVASLYNNKTHQVGFFDVKNELEKDYQLWYGVLNSLDYGIPQDRARLTLVGFRKDIVKTLLKNDYKLIETKGMEANDFVFKWPEKKIKKPKNIVWPKEWEFGSAVIKEEIANITGKYEQLTVKNAFSGLNDNSPNQNEHFEPYSGKFKTIGEGDTGRKSFKRLHRYRYSPTVAYGNNEVHLHPTEARRLTVREALRLQSVPDSYILPAEVSLTDKFKVISNGVPTKKAELIAKEIKRTLENYYALI